MNEAASVLQFSAMLLILIWAMNLIVTHLRVGNRLPLDGKRLEAALVEQLRLFARLCRSNLYLLEQQVIRLISTRILAAVFRANVGRVALLDEASVRHLIALHAYNEHIEMMVAERAKSIKSGRCTICVFDKSDNCVVETFRDLFNQAFASFERVIQDFEARKVTSDQPAATWASGERGTLLGSIDRSLDFADA